MNNILLNPGPTNTRFLTKVAQWFGSDVCHRTSEFSKILQETKQMLSIGFNGNRTSAKHVAIIGGSGTAAMESMVSSLVKDGIVVINAGVYGQRAVDMMKNYKIKHKEVKCKTIGDLDSGDESVEAVYFVENETTTGEHFSVDKMALLYPNAKLYVDATSSFGASNYDYVHHKIEALCFCSNKCLQSTPGLGVVIFNNKCTIKNRSYYLSLNKYITDKIPFTLPVQSVYALHQTLKLIDYSKQRIVFNKRRDKLIRELGLFGIYCVNTTPSNSIIGFQHPTLSYEELRDRLSKKGIVIYSGIPGIDNSFRLSTMSVLFDRKFNRIKKAFYDTCIR